MIRISLLQRLLLTIAFFMLLVAVSGGFGLWYSSSAEANVRAVQNTNRQLQTISALKSSWATLVKSVDDLLLTRYVSLYQGQLTANTAAFKRQLNELSQTSFGIYPATQEKNRQVLLELSQISTELDQALLDLNTAILSGRWTSALTLRQTRLATLQRNLENSLAQLDSNIQNDVNLASAQVAILQERARLVWLTANALAIVLGGLIAFITQRWLGGSIRELTAAVRRITTGDLSPVTPLRQQDEIGDLSRAFAMMTNWLRESYEVLEQRVAERTEDLNRRNMQLQVTAEVARDIAATRRLEDLLVQAVNLIRDRFGFYHAGIFLTDERREYAVLRSATGLAGQEMLAQSYRLPLGEKGLVAFACRTGQARIAAQVDVDELHVSNPWLPETRSEAVLPLRARGQIIGALDVQSKEPAAFKEEDIGILQLIADQLATAIQNSLLLQELQESLREVETAYSTYEERAWKRYVESLFTAGKQAPGYSFDGMTVSPRLYPADDPHVISIPLKVRDTVIGTLDLWPKASGNGSSGMSPDEMYLIAALSNRISQVLEAARLYEETRDRAAREQLAGEITAHMRASLDIQTVIQTALKEMSNRLGIPRIELSLFGGLPPQESHAGEHNGSKGISHPTDGGDLA